MNLVTLTSDYGNADHDIAAFKGQLLSDTPNSQIIDVSHAVSPYNVMQAAYLLGRTYKRFPAGTVHIILVDAYQGNDKNYLVAQIEGQYFVAADNGVLTLIAPDTPFEKIVAVDLRNTNQNLYPEDALAQIGAHLLKGGKPDVLGQPARDYTVKSASRPTLKTDGNGIIANVIHIDTFGNLVTNVTRKWLKDHVGDRKLIVVARNKRITRLVDSYFEGPTEGELFGVFNRDGHLEIAVQKPAGKFKNSACSLLGLHVNNNIFIEFE